MTVGSLLKAYWTKEKWQMSIVHYSPFGQTNISMCTQVVTNHNYAKKKKLFLASCQSCLEFELHSISKNSTYYISIYCLICSTSRLELWRRKRMCGDFEKEKKKHPSCRQQMIPFMYLSWTQQPFNFHDNTTEIWNPRNSYRIFAVIERCIKTE